jgi:hypothetical protein
MSAAVDRAVRVAFDVVSTRCSQRIVSVMEFVIVPVTYDDPFSQRSSPCRRREGLGWKLSYRETSNDRTRRNIMSRDPKQQRPSPSDGGDFARGERTLPAAPAGPDFARGERELPQPDVAPDYARGERELPPDGDGPDFARGQRVESDAGAPLLAPTKEKSDQVDRTNKRRERRQRKREEDCLAVTAFNRSYRRCK